MVCSARDESIGIVNIVVPDAKYEAKLSQPASENRPPHADVGGLDDPTEKSCPALFASVKFP